MLIQITGGRHKIRTYILTDLDLFFFLQKRIFNGESKSVLFGKKKPSSHKQKGLPFLGEIFVPLKEIITFIIFEIACL